MFTSFISHTEIQDYEAVFGTDIRDGILELIRKDFPNFQLKDCISLQELNQYRRLYLAQLVAEEKGALAAIDKDVMDALKSNAILSENIEPEIDSSLSYGQKLADKIADFGGSWRFIIFFFSFLILWMVLNIWVTIFKPFDPYPFILLNLILSCLAAIQAPIIMMSQNRKEEKDRLRAEHDYKVNLKAELEIKLLSEKLDHILVQQNKKLIEIQQVQIDYLEDLLKRIDSK